MVFQDPIAALNPRFRVREIVLEGARIQWRGQCGGGFDRWWDARHPVGMRPELAERFTRPLSGSQRPRVGIARTLLRKPEI